MAFSYALLRERIKDVFGTLAKFAKAMRMGRTALNAKLQGTSDFTQTEMLTAMDLLGIPREEVNTYFFSIKSSEK